MARPTTKSDLISAATANYAEMTELISSLAETGRNIYGWRKVKCTM